MVVVLVDLVVVDIELVVGLEVVVVEDAVVVFEDIVVVEVAELPVPVDILKYVSQMPTGEKKVRVLTRTAVVELPTDADATQVPATLPELPYTPTNPT